MNVIKKTTAILFIIFLSACSTDTNQEIFEEQNTLITSDLRTQEENPIVEIVIQFREHISEAEREEVRDRLISEEIITDYEIISNEVGIDRWIIRNPLCNNINKCILEMGRRCPCITPIRDIEDNDLIVILNVPGQK